MSDLSRRLFVQGLLLAAGVFSGEVPHVRYPRQLHVTSYDSVESDSDSEPHKDI
jgi:hypothetical protein